MSVRFRFNWVDSARSLDSAERRTMAALSIDAGNATVTSVLDKRNGVYRDHVVVPLFHVAEWLVAHWWHLWNEIPDTGPQRPGFGSRHDLAFAGDGFVLPHLEMITLSERVQMRWTRWKPRHAPIEFVEEAEIQVGRVELETELRNIVDAVLERLRDFEDSQAAVCSLAGAWDAINTLDSDERDFSRAAALLGLDPFDVQDSEATAIAAFWDRVAPAIREEALASATEDTLSSVSNWLEEALESLGRVESGTEWAAIRDVIQSPPTTEPWRQGYELARSVRDEIGLGDGRFDFPSQGPLALSHEVAELPSSRIQGLVAAHVPACITGLGSLPGQRFLLARAVGDYLSRPEPGAGILSSLLTDRQARSRAFAAEFLAPAQSLSERLETGFADEQTIDDLGVEFGVSSYVIQHQIKNHKLAVPVLSSLPLH